MPCSQGRCLFQGWADLFSESGPMHPLAKPIKNKTTIIVQKNLIGLFNYFDRHKCTYLLADTPYQLRSSDTYKQSGNTSKGINASATVNSEGRNMVKSWLQEPISIKSETIKIDGGAD